MDSGRAIRGGYSDWKRLSVERTTKQTNPSGVPQKTTSLPAKAARPRKRSFKENRELEALPAQIESLEREQAALVERLADPDLYREATKLTGVQERMARVEQELAACLSRWEELENIGGP